MHPSCSSRLASLWVRSHKIGSKICLVWIFFTRRFFWTECKRKGCYVSVIKWQHSEVLSRNGSVHWLERGHMETGTEAAVSIRQTLQSRPCVQQPAEVPGLLILLPGRLRHATTYTSLHKQSNTALANLIYFPPLHRHHSGVPHPHRSIPTFSEWLPRGNMSDRGVHLTVLSGRGLRCL